MSNLFYRKSSIIIPKPKRTDVSDLSLIMKIDEIKTFLTRITRDYLGINTIKMEFFLEDDDKIIIPRYFPIQKYISDIIIEDKIKDGDDIDITDNIELRDDLQINILNHFLNNENSVIQAQPGSGKTIVSIKMISERKKKTLILVHRDSLIDQWKERFLQYTNLKSDDISKLRSVSFKEDLSKPIILITDQTFTSLLRRNRKEFITELENANIGIFLADEVHTSVGAPTFAECSIHIPAKYVYGLSATPYRNDGNSDIIRYHLGEIFVPEGTATTMSARVVILLMSFGLLTSKTKNYIYWNNKFNRSRYLSQLRRSKSLNIISKKLLRRFYDENKQIIFVSERIKFIEDLYDSIDYSECKSKFIQSAGNEKLNEQITFATPGKIRDGVDCSQKNCLILTSPIGNIDQMCGRVCRWVKDKDQPVIIDIVDIDDKNVYGSMFHRLKYYNDTTKSKKEKWEIKFVYADNDGKLRVLKEEEFKAMFKNYGDNDD